MVKAEAEFGRRRQRASSAAGDPREQEEAPHRFPDSPSEPRGTCPAHPLAWTSSLQTGERTTFRGVQAVCGRWLGKPKEMNTPGGTYVPLGPPSSPGSGWKLPVTGVAESVPVASLLTAGSGRRAGSFRSGSQLHLGGCTKQPRALVRASHPHVLDPEELSLFIRVSLEDEAVPSPPPPVWEPSWGPQIAE